MDVSLFDYDLPPERISQVPAGRRDGSRLLVMDRDSGAVAHREFVDIGASLQAGDLLVVNDARVVPARLWGVKPTGGRVELLVMRALDAAPPADGQERWSCLVRASRRPAPGVWFEVADNLQAAIVEECGHGEAVVCFRPRGEASPPAAGAAGSRVAAALETQGEMPLPPYIRRVPGDARSAADRSRYQTIFASVPGAVAAPTAGLHFTPEVLADLDARGIAPAALTLLVGPGTFRPVTAQRAEDHLLAPETFELPAAVAEAVRDTRRRGGRVVACGTTVVRVLEARATGDRLVEPGAGECDLFIRPGHTFRVVDALLTNFHLPRSTLLMLVCAFAGREQILAAYREAVERHYRFFSYGDAMLIHRGGTEPA